MSSTRPPGSPDSDVRPGRCATAPLSALVGSSQYRALADDTLKDEDNAAWVLSLEPDVRRAWVSRIHWIRLVDRLAENERFEPSARRFARFLEEWRRLRTDGVIDPASPFVRELGGIRAQWLLPPEGGAEDGPAGERQPPSADAVRRAVEAWDAYLEALVDYHAHEIVVPTLHAHDEMLWRLSGRIFQLVPYLSDALWDAAGELGRLDQFFNNLRDIHEDAEHGICYLPADVLARFGVTRDEILSGRCFDNPGYARLMRFWLDQHLPTLYARADEFLSATDLHPSLIVMRAWSLRRYQRIERVFRATGFDFRRFRARYWTEVRHELLQIRVWTRPEPPAPAQPT